MIEMLNRARSRLVWCFGGALALMVSVSGCSRSETELATPVSLIQLIANPTDYHGKRIVVVGYLSMDFESVGLYLSEADYRLKILTNMVRLDIDDRLVGSHLANGGYAFVEGTITPKSGPIDFSCGRVTRITQLEPWPIRGPNVPSAGPADAGNVPKKVPADF